MNRDRFRFRVWSEKLKGYYFDMRLTVDGDLVPSKWLEPNSIPDLGRTVIEQCTGITDKNGKLIYEGDVVRVEDECGICDPMMNCDTGIGVITWVCGMWYIARNVNLGLYDAKQVNYIEIIGNIHDDQFRDATKMVEG